MQSILPPSAALHCHQAQSYAAIQCNGMLPPSAITKWCAKSHPRHRRAVAQRRFDQDVVGVRRWRVWCGLRRPNRNQRFEFQTVWMRISACWRKSTIERKPIGGALPTLRDQSRFVAAAGRGAFDGRPNVPLKPRTGCGVESISPSTPRLMRLILKGNYWD